MSIFEQSAFGVDHEVSKRLSPKTVAGLAAGGALGGAVVAGPSSYLSGRFNRVNEAQSKKMGGVGGAMTGALGGLAAAGPIGAAGGATTGALLGRAAAGAGARHRIKRNKRR